MISWSKQATLSTPWMEESKTSRIIDSLSIALALPFHGFHCGACASKANWWKPFFFVDSSGKCWEPWQSTTKALKSKLYCINGHFTCLWPESCYWCCMPPNLLVRTMCEPIPIFDTSNNLSSILFWKYQFWSPNVSDCDVRCWHGPSADPRRVQSRHGNQEIDGLVCWRLDGPFYDQDGNFQKRIGARHHGTLLGISAAWMLLMLDSIPSHQLKELKSESYFKFHASQSPQEKWMEKHWVGALDLQFGGARAFFGGARAFFVGR